ncbi:MAG TPA: hypothetical protein EYP39_04365, partial [Ghiorsea sp.]|nr:hypothetical protein [Ghiorsea sp.]
MAEHGHVEQGQAEEHGSSIADHLEYWTYKFDETNPFMQIHVPLQSGSTSLLKSMRRGYTKEWFINRCEKI